MTEEEHCARCGRETKGEATLVGTEVWCHPCADAQTPFHPDSNLPGCMMPDGGECCEGYQALLADWRRLRGAAGADGVAAYERGFKDGVFVGRNEKG
jgi:hypothetical protein